MANSNKISKEAYLEWLKKKIKYSSRMGIELQREHVHEKLKPHQVDAVVWAATGGRRAVFGSFGMGKTFIQLQLANAFYNAAVKGEIQVPELADGADWENEPRCLIICPLSVVGEFEKDAKKLGMRVQYVRNRYEVLHSECNILITNYERVRDGDIQADDFIYVTMDEASAIRSLGSKTYLEFSKKFANTRYKTVATATPAPNDYIELLNYAAFLGIMDVSQAKTRWFKRNSERADELTLMEGKEDEFWLWVFSWALFIRRPSSLGYSNDGYDLPGLKVHFRMIPDAPADIIKDGKVNSDWVTDRGEIRLYKETARKLDVAARHKRDSIDIRVDAALGIIGENDPDKHWLLWHHLEPERKALDKAFKGDGGYVSVYGSQADDIKAAGMNGFADGQYKYLATKPEIAGQGRNFQEYCHNAIFLGINYKFNDFIQAIHRIYRFLQVHECNVYIIYMESEQHILDKLLEKWREHDELVERMEELLKRFGLNNIGAYQALERTMGVEREEENGQDFTAVLNDTILEHMELPDNFFGLQFSSWPFAKQYEYSASYHDMGHNETNELCFEQLDFLVPNLYRTLQPGRISAVHVKDRIIFGNFSGLGFPTVYPFSDEVRICMERHGFAYCGRITITTDVVRENAQTYRLGHTENGKDSSKMSVGVSEYIMIFRKPQTDLSRGYADVRVTKDLNEYTRGRWQIDAHGYWKSNGDRLLEPDEIAEMGLERAMAFLKSEQLKQLYNYERHVEIAEAMDNKGILPTDFMAVTPHTTDVNVWTDVTRMRGLNTYQGQRKEEQHLCPLPFDIVKRVIVRWSNPGELVGDAFGGILTVPYVAVELGRKGWACELNYDYWKTGVGYCREIEYKRNVPGLFDLLEKETEAK